MFRTMLKSKIHRATVTQADLHYVGSVTVDQDLMDAADLLAGEQVAIVDVTNGARLETYVIAGRAARASSASTARLPASCTPATSSSSSRTESWRTPRRGTMCRGSCSSTARTASSAPAPTPPTRSRRGLLRGDAVYPPGSHDDDPFLVW